MPDPTAPEPPEPTFDLQQILDESLQELSDKLRIAVVLCVIEGLTREEAARRLNVAVGTLSGRLTTAHRKLAAILKRRGVACPVAGVVVLSPVTLTAQVPPGLAASTAAAGVSVAGSGLAASGATPSAEDLARTVLSSLQAGKWKAIFLLSAGLLMPGIVFSHQVRSNDAVPMAPSGVAAPPEKAAAVRLGFPETAQMPQVKPQRDTPIANDMSDIFVISDFDETITDFFRHSRSIIAPISAAKYRELASSHERWVNIPLPINAVNDPQYSQRASRTVPVVPPSDAVRKLLDPIAGKRAIINVIIRREGIAGGNDLVGYTDRPTTPDFFEKAEPIVHAGDLTQKDLLFDEPPMPLATPIRARHPASAAIVIANAIRERPVDIRIVSDRNISVTEYFQQNRVGIGCLFVADYEKLVRTDEPWLELPVYPISFNDELPLAKRVSRTIRVAPPTPFVETRLFRPSIRQRPDIDAFTVMFRRDQPEGVLEIVGFSSARTSFQFFQKNVRFADADDLLQRDLRYRPQADESFR